MSEIEFIEVERPTLARHSARRGMADAIRRTLASGKAISIPVNGETYAVARNRCAARGQAVAKELSALLRTQKSEDSKCVLIWLEPKA